MDDETVFSVSDFVAVLNQTLEFAYPRVTIEGELANFRVSKNRWVYFDLKDELATVRFFGTVYQLPGPLEDGLMLRVSGSPRLHPQYSFSVNVQTITPVGEGSIRRAADLLQAKLAAEGLFDEDRKRPLPYPPKRIGLITAANSAAYADFIKITDARWRGLEIWHHDVLVQGDQAPSQIVQAIERLNEQANLPDVLVIIRGGGSADDLQAFSTEAVTRAVAASRVPTLVAIGHEVDFSLAELAADMRASTPSNAAELLLPDRQYILRSLREGRSTLRKQMARLLEGQRDLVGDAKKELRMVVENVFAQTRYALELKKQLFAAYDPAAALRRGYALVRLPDGALVKQIGQAQRGTMLHIEVADGTIMATTNSTKKGRNDGKKD